MKKNYYYTFLKNYKTLLYIIYVGLLAFIIYIFHKRWNDDAQCYSDNVIIEVFAGLIFSIVPLILGLNIGKKLNSDILHFKFRDLFREISIERKNKKINPKASRRLVIEIAKSFGDEITSQSWYEKIETKLKDPKNRDSDCGVCGLSINIEHEKCKYCKLNCFAWEKLD